MPDIKPDISTIQLALATTSEQENATATVAQPKPGTIRIKNVLELCAPAIQSNHSVTNAQSATTEVSTAANETASPNVNTPPQPMAASAASTTNATAETAIRVKTEPGLELNTTTTAVDNSAGTNELAASNADLELQTSTAAVDVVEYNADNVKLEPFVAANSTEEAEMPAAAERSAPLAIECVAPTDISEDFFSDLIDLPQQAAPLETLPMEDLERKYSETLRETLLLDEMAQQRQKRASRSTNNNDTAEKRTRLTAENDSAAIPFIRVKTEFRTETDVPCLPVQTDASTTKRNADVDIKCIATFNEIEDFADRNDGTELAQKAKRDVAYGRVNYVLDLFKKEATAAVQLIHTDTVRKLPTHTQYMSQQFYDNRSPLHSANNVQFSFNSPYTNFNMEDWGLQALSPKIARIARIIGCDAYMLNWKRMVTKKPYVRDSNKTADEQKQCATASTYFSNIMTQTDITGPVCKQPPKVRTVTISTQTDAKQESTPSFLACVQKFPHLMRMNELNANQLLALDDFVELMHQDDIAADVHRLRENLLRIFHRAQMPVLNNRPGYAAAAPMPNYIPLQTRNTASSPPPPPKISDFAGHYNMPQFQQMPHYHQMPQSHQMPSRPHQLYNVPQAQPTRNMHNSDPRKRNLWFQQEPQAQPNVRQNSNTGSRYHPY